MTDVVDRKQIRHKLPDTFTINGKPVTEQKEIANAFNNYFALIGTDMANKLPTEEYLDLDLFNRFQVQPTMEEEVEKLMKSQKTKLSCGLDSINNKVVKI